VGSSTGPNPGAARRTVKRWIVVVFMGADNLETEADLQKQATTSIDQMRRVIADARNVKRDVTLEVVYQLHTKDGVTREHVGYGDPQPVEMSQQDAVDGMALLGLLDAVKTAIPPREGDCVMLVLWGHVQKFAFGAQMVNGATDALDFAELARVLRDVDRTLKQFQRAVGGALLDIVAFDSCDASTIEIAAQLAPFARYLLASQIRMPLPGFPYDRILERVAQPQGQLMGPAEFGTWTVRRFCEFYSAELTDTVSLTLLDLQQIPMVVAYAEHLSRALARAIDANAEDFDEILDLFVKSRLVDRRVDLPPKPFVDVADLCLNLLLRARSAAVRDAARVFGNLLLSPKPVEPRRSETGFGRPFVVEHGGNAATTARLNGVSLFAPHVAGANALTSEIRARYEAFDFARETLWGPLVFALAGD
jgi:hypothetical protein